VHSCYWLGEESHPGKCAVAKLNDCVLGTWSIDQLWEYEPVKQNRVVANWEMFHFMGPDI